MTDRIPAEYTDVKAVHQAIGMAFEILDQHELEKLHDILTDGAGTLSILDPTAFMHTQADPQWPAKCELVSAAADFVRRVAAGKATLPPDAA